MVTATITQPIKPQPGPQELFLRANTRIAFYGGAAGGGKSYACLLEPTYHIDNPEFQAVIFRKYHRQLIAPGGLWRRSFEIYPQLGGKPNKSELQWTFPSGATIKFAYMQYESDVQSWKGSEIPLIEVDEVTEMSFAQFFYLFSRNRSLSGVRPYMRAYTNPDPESWVKVVLAPWVDDEWEDPERNSNTPEHLRKKAESGEVRYFVVEDENIRWCNSDEKNAISITFVFANLYDNKILMEKDPGYEAGLDALPEVEKQRLKFGDWSARPSGKKFRREWFEKRILDGVPDDIERKVRFWDLAATEEVKSNSKKNGPDYTAGVLMARRKEGCYPRYVILHAIWERRDPGGVEDLLKEMAAKDGRDSIIRIEQEPGASGKSYIYNLVTKVLPGYDVDGVLPGGSKELRANTMSAQAKFGNVGMIRAHWNKGLINFLCAFPNPAIHDDPVDASSGAMNELYLVPDGPMIWSAEDMNDESVSASPERAPSSGKPIPSIFEDKGIIEVDEEELEEWR